MAGGGECSRSRYSDYQSAYNVVCIRLFVDGDESTLPAAGQLAATG